MTLEEANERFRELVNTNKGFLSNIAEDKTEWNSTYYKSMCEDVKAMEIILDYIENESIPKEKIRNLLNEISKEKAVVMSKILTEDYFHLAEYGAVAQELGYIEAQMKRILGE